MHHDPELVELLHTPERAIRHISERAIRQGTLTVDQAAELLALFGEIPDVAGAGLDAADVDHFLCATLQLIEVCLLDEPEPRRPLVNALLQEQLTQHCAEQGGGHWELAREICDEARRGTDRRFTFGQIKEIPADPRAPSLFGGAWQADCDGEARRVTFMLTAEMVPGSSAQQPVTATGVEYERLETRLRTRGPYPWKLQVEPDSELGRWIARLAGSENIGQHRGGLPLGVLCDAVQRGLEPEGLTHLLLGPSRRDAPTRPWHTGSFLRRVADTFDFDWAGHAMARDAAGKEQPVVVRCTVRMAARIVSLSPAPGTA